MTCFCWQVVSGGDHSSVVGARRARGHVLFCYHFMTRPVYMSYRCRANSCDRGQSLEDTHRVTDQMTVCNFDIVSLLSERRVGTGLFFTVVFVGTPELMQVDNNNACYKLHYKRPCLRVVVLVMLVQSSVFAGFASSEGVTCITCVLVRTFVILGWC